MTVRPHNLRRTGAYALVAATAGIAAALAVRAGPLSPPAGPVASTYKTLGDIEPRIFVQSLPGSAQAVYVISAPGSYYLAGPVTGAAGKSGILIDAAGVWLDLRGFVLTGTPGAVSGITATAAARDLRIHDGVARGWPLAGVDLSAAGPAGVDRVTASACGTGILVGAGATVSGCTADGNSSGGISTGIHTSVLGCTATGNGSDGFYLSDGCTIEGCLAAGNGSDGAYLDGDGCTAQRCTFRLSGARGLVSIYSAAIDSCTAEYNHGAGFEVQGPCTLRECVAAGNDGGGIWALDGTTVTASRAKGNTGFGISIRANGRVESCDCGDNRTPAPGSGVGILLLGGGNRIEACTLSLNDVGVRAALPGNVIVRNSAAGNTMNYDLGQGQLAGPIITDPGAVAGAGPWVNFSR